MLRIEFEEPHTQTCECCGGTTSKLTRFVYSEGIAHAVYYASFTDKHLDRVVYLAVSLGDWEEGSAPNQRRAFALKMRATDNQYEVTVTDASESPWRGVAILGPMLDRQEALEHPWIDDIFHITDHIALADQWVKKYLAESIRPTH